MKKKVLSMLSILVFFALSLNMAVTAQVPENANLGVKGEELPISAAPDGTYQQGVDSQSQHVALAGQVDGATAAMAVKGNYAFIGVGPRLVIMNIAEPAQPTLVGQTELLPGLVNGAVVAGQYAYIIAGDHELLVFDVSWPSVPRETGSFTIQGTAGEMFVSGRFLYVVDIQQGVYIIDVSQPDKPVEAGFFQAPPPAAGIAVAGNLLFIANGDYGLRIVDVSLPNMPS